MKNRISFRSGFTMVELMVVVVIVGVLSALAVGGARVAIKGGNKANELAAGRNLINAYLLASVENGGRYLAGMDYTVKEVDFEGKTLKGHMAQRYPFRLAPYFNYQLEGTILVNKNSEQIHKAMSTMYDYGVSTYPALGINRFYVGGNWNLQGKLSYPEDCVTNQGQASSSPLVFVSGGSGTGSGKMEGYNIITPPHTTNNEWSGLDWSRDRDPAIYGNVDARHDGKAVCAFLDGSVRMLGIEELRDMRLWNKNAAAANNPDYYASSATVGGL